MVRSPLDQLQPADATNVARLLEEFWRTSATLPDLIRRREHLLAANATAALRQTVLELMLALNGIAWPQGVTHLNAYLSESQRVAIEKTLLTPAIREESWIGQAVALIVIYRWYAPQLVEKFALVYPQALEEAALMDLQHLPGWPLSITTD
jgi:hypothetical protein